MIKTIIVDKNIQSLELLKNNLKNIQNISVVECYQNVFEIRQVENVDLILFDINSKESEQILAKINELKKTKESLKFIALSYEINSGLVNLTLKEGVSDFLLKPVIPSILETAINKIHINTNTKAKTISVFSNKGGVGKTSLAINLAYEIYKETNSKICVLDLSFNNEDVSVFLDIQQKYDIDYIMKNIENSNKEAILSLISKYQDTSLYVLEAQENISPELNYTPQKINKIINSLKNIFDYIIIDTSIMINEMNIAILNSSDLILLIASLNMASIRNCQKCYELFDKIGYDNDKIKLVVNRYIENQDITLEDIENSVGRKVFGIIPNNYLTLIDSINIGRTVGEVNPQSNIAKAYARIAGDIIKLDFADLQTKTNYNHGIFNLLQRMGE
ncbi:AAA family ATPase [bacterium]|nr:AAA family ATPase [bacterium]